MAPKSDWVWMPHAGHLIVGSDCRFHLNTWVGNYIVSTVGEYWPDSRVREIFAETRGITIKGRGEAWDNDYLKKIGYEPIGGSEDSLYETMVFPARISIDHLDDGPQLCCPYVASEWSVLDSRRYAEAKDALAGHMELCEKWADELSLGELRGL